MAQQRAQPVDAAFGEILADAGDQVGIAEILFLMLEPVALAVEVGLVVANLVERDLGARRQHQRLADRTPLVVRREVEQRGVATPAVERFGHERAIPSRAPSRVTATSTSPSRSQMP